MMKKIFLLAAMLWSVAYGQSKVYIRGDSIVVQKVGGNGELIIENGTRNVTGGVLTNMGNGRTRFVLPSGGGGDSSFGVKDTLFNADRYVNMEGNEFSFDDGTVIHGGDKRAVGTRMLKTFNSTTAVFSATLPSATVNYASSGMTIDLGNGTLANYLETPDSVGLFSSHEMTTSFDVIGVEYDSQSLGFALGYIAQGNGQSLVTLFRLTDTAAYVNTALSAALPTANTYSSKDYYSFKRSAGDTLHVDMIRNSYAYYVKVYNKANGSSMQASIGQIQTSNCKLRIYPLGGEWRFLNLRVTYNDIANAMLIFLGDSITTALTGESENSRTMSQVASGMDGGYVDMSGAAEQSIDGYRRTAETIRFFDPTNATVIWGYVVNDRNGSVNIDSFAARTRRSFDALIAAGFRIVAVNGTPQTAGSIVAYNDTLATICTQRNIMLINKYALLVAAAGTAMDTKYDYGDGIHENQLAMDVAAAYLRQKLLDSGYIRLGGPVKNFPKPIASNYYYHNVTLADGTEAKAVAGTEAGYLHLIAADNDATVYQGGPGKKRNFNLHGDGWITSMRFGTAPQTNVHVWDQTGIKTSTATISSNLTVGVAAAANRLEVSTDIVVATKKLQFFNQTGALVEANSLAFRIDRFLPQSGTKIGIYHKKSSAGGGVDQSDWRQFVFENVDGITQIEADNNGSISSIGVHNYKADSLATILSSARNIPDVGAVQRIAHDTADVLRALIVGGSVPDADYGDITVSSGVWSIDDDVVTYAKMQNVSATSRFLGRITSGAGNTEELTGTQATTLLDEFTSGLKGLAPASGGGTTNFLRADGTWAVPPGGGGSGSPGGSDGQVQYRVDGSTFGGISNATTDGTTLTMTSARATTDFSPSTNDGASLGTSSLRWSDADFADGAVLRFNNSYTLTHSTGILTSSGSLVSGNKIKIASASGGFQVGARNNPTGTAWEIYSGTGELSFYSTTERFTLTTGGNLGLGQTSPTAVLHLKAGTTSASSAPLKFTSGTSMTSAEAGAVEFTTDDLFFTITTGTARKRFLFADQAAGLTSGTVPVATTNGRLTDGLIIASTTYTPTLTNVTNVSASTLQSASYTRVGSIVTLTIKVEVDATGAGATELGLSLPVASNFGDIDDVRGNVTEDTEVGAVEADTTNDRIKLTYSAQGAGTDMFTIVLQYTII